MSEDQNTEQAQTDTDDVEGHALHGTQGKLDGKFSGFSEREGDVTDDDDVEGHHLAQDKSSVRIAGKLADEAR